MRRYDLPTAVTFLFAGLGLGAVLAILFAPRDDQSRDNQSTDEQSGSASEQLFDSELLIPEPDEALISRAV